MRTGTVTVTNNASGSAVVADVACKFIDVEEQNAGTSDYDAYSPDMTVTPERKLSGAVYRFEKSGGGIFTTAETVGYLKSIAAGPLTFNKRMI